MASDPTPGAAPNYRWLRLRVKPKAPVSSTPSHEELWIVVGDNKKKIRSISFHHPETHDLQLHNRYDIFNLSEFPLLAGNFQSPPRRLTSELTQRLGLPGQQTRPTPRRSRPNYTPAPRRFPSSHSFGCPPFVASSSHDKLAPPPVASPLTLVIGDSIVRHVRGTSTKTCCFPGAKVADILERRVFISGPITPLSRGVGRFSKVLSPHTWLQTASIAHGMFFVDNLNLLWNRPSFFSRDGIHLCRLGAHTLTNNILNTVESTPSV
uniref:Uncharacterized protein n=1 Tax=Labrus bergylta TaxID=56723 RepID=A0A3Q3GV16_9LABR